MAIRTLIVDDHQDVRILLRTIIELAGMSVSGEAADGEEALAVLDEADPDVILLDEMMPGLSGLETAALIRARRPGQRIVLCSAAMDDGLRRKAAEAGIGICLTKYEMSRVPDALREAATA